MKLQGIARESIAKLEPSQVSAAGPTRGYVLYAYITFVVIGVMTTMLGPLLPLLAKQWDLQPATAGALFSWQFGGATVGTLLAATQVRRRSSRTLTTVGLLCCATGTAAMAMLPWPQLVIAVGLYGIGLGFC